MPRHCAIKVMCAAQITSLSRIIRSPRDHCMLVPAEGPASSQAPYRAMPPASSTSGRSLRRVSSHATGGTSTM